MISVMSPNFPLHFLAWEFSESAFQVGLVAACRPPEMMDISCPFASGHGIPPPLQVSDKCLCKGLRTCTIRRRPQTPEGSRGRYLRQGGHVLHENREGVHLYSYLPLVFNELTLTIRLRSTHVNYIFFHRRVASITITVGSKPSTFQDTNQMVIMNERPPYFSINATGLYRR